MSSWTAGTDYVSMYLIYKYLGGIVTESVQLDFTIVK
jgi:hypothetical protein